jgi:hypothetical protein
MKSNRTLSTVLLVLVLCLALTGVVLYGKFAHATECPWYCVNADVNKDGSVDTADSFIVAKCIKANCPYNESTEFMDVNQDKTIDQADINAIVTCLKMGCCKPQ